jgi:hypothetical protein
MEYPFEDENFMDFFKNNIQFFNPEQFIFSALGLLATGKLDNGVNIATSNT